MAFMMLMTVWSLVALTTPLVKSFLGKAGPLSPDAVTSGICGIVLLAMTFGLILQALRTLPGKTRATRGA
jgi:hypothetical protein